MKKLIPTSQFDEQQPWGTKIFGNKSSVRAKNPIQIIVVIGITLASFLIANTSLAQNSKKKPSKVPEVQIQKDTNKDTTTTDSPSNSILSGELLLEILLGELNNEQGVPATGFSLILDAAKKTQDAGLYKRAVEIALQARSGPSALEAARAWKNSDPTSKVANRFVLDILIALNKVDQTEEPLRTDLLLTPQVEQSQAISLIPQLYLQVNDKNTAATIVEKALGSFVIKSDTSSVSWISIARMRLLSANSTSALEALKKGLALDRKSKTGALLAIELASAHTQGAEELVKQAIQSANDPIITLQWVRSLIEMDRLVEAGAQIKQITESSPKFADAWLLLGGLQLEQGSYETSEQSLKIYLKLADESPESVNSQSMGQAYLMLAQIAQKNKNEELTESWLAKIEDPQLLMRAQFQRAGMLANKGKMQDAIALIENLPTKTPEERRAKVLGKAQLFRDFKDFTSAYEILSKYSNANPSDVDVAYEFSMVAERLKKYDEMEKILRKIITTHPDYAQAYNALGFSLADRNIKLKEAKQLIVKALEFSPEDPFITDSLGWVEYRLGNTIEALAILERAYASKTDPEIAAHLGEVMWILKRNEDAIRTWDEGLSKNQNNEVLLETIKRLKTNR